MMKSSICTAFSSSFMLEKNRWAFDVDGCRVGGAVRGSASPGDPIIDEEGVAKMGARFVESDLAHPRPVIGI